MTSEHSKRRRTRRATSRHDAPGPLRDVATKSEVAAEWTELRALRQVLLPALMPDGKRGLPTPMRPLENQAPVVKLWNQS